MTVGGNAKGQISQSEDGSALDNACGIQMFVLDNQAGFAVALIGLNNFDTCQCCKFIAGEEFSRCVCIHEVVMG